MSYKYISIPTSRLSEEWLRNNNFDPEEDIDTFITYTVVINRYDHYNLVNNAEEEFICNTQEEFEQMIAQAKLEKIL